MAFQSEQKIKTQILTCLGPDQLFRLLSDSDIQILMKTLGLLRNLLSNKPVSFILMSVYLIKYTLTCNDEYMQMWLV